MKMLIPQKLTTFLLNPVARSIANRNLWAYVAIAFNRVDAERLKLVGPDRLCAEWVLKNGGAIEFSEIAGRFIKDYNVLPPEGNKLTVKSIDASNSSIMRIGLDHLIGCKKIDNVILHQCKHLESGSLSGLLHIQNTLKFLQVSGCDNFSDEDFEVLGNLKVLEKLTIADMKYVKNIESVIQKLRTALPNCNVINE
ncbi:ATP5S family protein [Megaselia abdita]